MLTYKEQSTFDLCELGIFVLCLPLLNVNLAYLIYVLSALVFKNKHFPKQSRRY